MRNRPGCSYERAFTWGRVPGIKKCSIDLHDRERLLDAAVFTWSKSVVRLAPFSCSSGAVIVPDGSCCGLAHAVWRDRGFAAQACDVVKRRRVRRLVERIEPPDSTRENWRRL